MFLHNRTIINSFHKVSFYNMRTKLHRMMITDILMSWSETFDSKQKTQKVQKDQRLVFQKKL